MILSKDRAIYNSFRSINKLTGIVDADSTYGTLTIGEKAQMKSKKFIKSTNHATKLERHKLKCYN